MYRRTFISSVPFIVTLYVTNALCWGVFYYLGFIILVCLYVGINLNLDQLSLDLVLHQDQILYFFFFLLLPRSSPSEFMPIIAFAESVGLVLLDLDLSLSFTLFSLYLELVKCSENSSIEKSHYKKSAYIRDKFQKHIINQDIISLGNYELQALGCTH